VGVVDESLAGLQSVRPAAEPTYPGWEYPTVSASLCALLLVLALKPGTWANRAFGWPPLRVLGVLSFSLYLVHPFVLESLTSLGAPKAGVALFLPNLLLSLAIGVILERGVERPFMALGRRINARF